VRRRRSDTETPMQSAITRRGQTDTHREQELDAQEETEPGRTAPAVRFKLRVLFLLRFGFGGSTFILVIINIAHNDRWEVMLHCLEFIYPFENWLAMLDGDISLL